MEGHSSAPTSSRKLVEYLLFFLLLGLVLSAVAYGGYWYGYRLKMSELVEAPLSVLEKVRPDKNSSLETSLETPALDETAGWELYTNSKLGFSLLHPKEWVTEIDTSDPSEEKVVIKEPTAVYVVLEPFGRFLKGAYLTVSILPWKHEGDIKTLDPIVTGPIPNSDGVIESIEYLKVDGFDAKKIKSDGLGPVEPNYSHFQVKILKGSKVYSITVSYHKGGSYNEDFANLMLSTFRFLDQN